jgi:chemotaxis protein histidine kinase CheA
MTVEPAPESEPPFYDLFLTSAEELVRRLTGDVERLRSVPPDPAALPGLLHGFHALRGNCSFVPGCPLTSLAQAAEEAVEAAVQGRLDSGRLATQLADAVDYCSARLKQYRQFGFGGGPDARATKLAASLFGLARGEDSGAARAKGPRFHYAGHDVTEILELLMKRHETSEANENQPARGGIDQEARLARAYELLRRLATDAGDDEFVDSIAEEGVAPGGLLRLLARRVKRVPGD